MKTACANCGGTHARDRVVTYAFPCPDCRPGYGELYALRELARVAVLALDHIEIKGAAGDLSFEFLEAVHKAAKYTTKKRSRA